MLKKEQKLPIEKEKMKSLKALKASILDRAFRGALLSFEELNILGKEKSDEIKKMAGVIE